MPKATYRIVADLGFDVTPPRFYRLKRSVMSRVAQEIADARDGSVTLVNDKTGNWWDFDPKESSA